MSLFSNFPQGGKKAGVQSISDGGTGATTAEAALANLGGFPKTDGEALKTRIQPINLGGTGASEANQARQNLGAAAVKEMTKAEYDALPAIDPTIFYALTDVEADGVKIETGSYVGKETKTVTLSFPFTPRMVVVATGTSYIICISGAQTAFHTDDTYIRNYVDFAWSANSVTLTSHSSAYINASGKTYYYLAIG